MFRIISELLQFLMLAVLNFSGALMAPSVKRSILDELKEMLK